MVRYPKRQWDALTYVTIKCGKGSQIQIPVPPLTLCMTLYISFNFLVLCVLLCEIKLFRCLPQIKLSHFFFFCFCFCFTLGFLCCFQIITEHYWTSSVFSHVNSDLSNSILGQQLLKNFPILQAKLDEHFQSIFRIMTYV